MAANTNPIYTRVADIQWGAAAITTANTAKDGTGTVVTVFTADATEGGYIDKIIARPIGTNTASVLRIFINNGSSSATPANNCLIAELSLPATTLTEVAENVTLELPLKMALPPGYKLNATIGTTVAAGYMLCGVGGKY
jgi:hypothetical protein